MMKIPDFKGPWSCEKVDHIREGEIYFVHDALNRVILRTPIKRYAHLVAASLELLKELAKCIIADVTLGKIMGKEAWLVIGLHVSNPAIAKALNCKPEDITLDVLKQLAEGEKYAI